MPRRGGKGKNEKNVPAWSMGNSSIVCNYSHIPKTASVVPAKERRRVTSLSHYWQGGDTLKVLRRGGAYREDQFTLIWTDEGKKKSQLYYCPPKKKYQRLPFLIGLCWLLSRGNLESRGNSDEFRSLTFAGVGGRFRTAGVSEEARLAVLAVAALRVVVAVVAHAATAPS